MEQCPMRRYTNFNGGLRRIRHTEADLTPKFYTRRVQICPGFENAGGPSNQNASASLDAALACFQIDTAIDFDK
jgi:hypothetical protein